MGREVQGENSSSQNVNISIQSIKRGAGRNKTEVLFSDGSSFFIPDRFVLENDLQPGLFLSVDQIERLKDVSEYIFAKRKALELLGYREHSVNQLKQKLLTRKFTVPVVARILNELQTEGSLSNSRFMEIWVDNRLRNHPEGYRSLYKGLIQAGIPSGDAEVYLKSYLEEFDTDQLLERAADKILRKPNITKTKIVRALQNRGFNNSAIIRYIEDRFPEENLLLH